MLQVVEINDTKYLYASSEEDYKESLKSPFLRRKQFTIGTINGLTIKMTDCSWTYDHMMKELRKAVILIKDLSHGEMYEVLINLNKKGIDNMNEHLFSKWNHSDVDIWTYRSILKTLKLVKELRYKA